MNISGNAAVSIDSVTVSRESSVSVSDAIETGVKTTITPLRPLQPSETKPREITREDVEATVDALKEMTATLQTKMDFSINEGTNSLVVKVVDQDTEKVIKQFPAEELLELQEKMQDLTGFLFTADV